MMLKIESLDHCLSSCTGHNPSSLYVTQNNFRSGLLAGIFLHWGLSCMMYFNQSKNNKKKFIEALESNQNNYAKAL